jgi:hypothetical protein
MPEICRGLWLSINWTRSASRWFHYTDILWCTVSKILSILGNSTHVPGIKRCISYRRENNSGKRNILLWNIWIKIRIKMQIFNNNKPLYPFLRSFSLEEKRYVYDAAFLFISVCDSVYQLRTSQAVFTFHFKLIPLNTSVSRLILCVS